MRRIVAALVPAVVGLAASGGLSPAAGDDGPALTPPSVTGPDVVSPGELPGVIEATPLPDKGAVLVVPGVTAPSAPRRTFQNRVNSSINRVPWITEGTPPLVGPSEMREAATGSAPTSRTPTPSTGPRVLSDRPPLTLESIPADELKDGSPSPESGRPRTPSESRTTPPPSLLRRPGGLFGRLLPPSPINRRDDESRDAVKVEPRTDPAADAALKRRVEKQIGESLGGRLKSFEVRVVGREVSVIARASRFWQKRSVRNALEALPALTGTKSKVEVID